MKRRLYELARPVDMDDTAQTERINAPKPDLSPERKHEVTNLERLCDEVIFRSESLIRSLRMVIAGEYGKRPKVDYGELLEIAECGERLALCTRKMAPSAGNFREASPIERLLLDIMPVEIGYTDERWFCIRMPMLLPKKESKASREYLNSWLYPVLSDYFCKLNTPVVRRCVIIYRHVYEYGRAKRMYRDHDNIEIKQVTDAIAMYLMIDDTPSMCSHYHCSAKGKTSCTEVYVVSKEDFAKWLAQEPDFPPEGVNLFTPPEYLPKKDM